MSEEDLKILLRQKEEEYNYKINVLKKQRLKEGLLQEIKELKDKIYKEEDAWDFGLELNEEGPEDRELNEGVGYGDRLNIDLNDSECITDWGAYGINPNDVNPETLKNNYLELSKKYEGNIMYIFVVFAFSDLRKRGLSLPPSYCKTFVKNMKYMTYLQFKNPYLLILGKWIMTNDKRIDPVKFKKALSIIDEISDYKLFGEDLIRYFRYWEKII